MDTFASPLVVALIAVLVLLVVLLAIVLWSTRRHRDPDMKIDCDSPIDELMPSLAGLSMSAALEGNSVEVLENGAYFDALVEAIGKAKRSVHFETFLWKEGRLGNRVAEALAERGRAGLEVRVLLDAIGCKKIGEAAERNMRDAGCKVVKFHPWHIRNLGVMNDRTHRKLVVLDGDVAYVGGHCVVDEWQGDAEDGKHFADISVKLRGPIVHSVQSAFAENWVEETGELFVGDTFFPSLGKEGDVTAYAAYVKPEGSPPAVKVLHHTVICLAKRKMWIQNPYFLPEPEAIDAFGQAVKRGVDVRVLMPSEGGSDNPMVQHAAHRNFEKLLECGVRLFEYPHTLLHQKVLTIDDTWCAVGSSNFDDRSFEISDEITLGFADPRTARTLDAIFEKYAARATEVKLDVWRKRPFWRRARDQMYYLFNEML